MPEFSDIWREPAEESEDLYPNLVIYDARVSGSITFGPTRLPLWAPYLEYTDFDDYVYEGQEERYSEYKKSAEEFLRHLLEMRGEFARLLLVLADAERQDRLKEEEWFKTFPAEMQESGMYRVLPVPEGVEDHPPWWKDPELKDIVRNQLLNCLKALDLSEREEPEE